MAIYGGSWYFRLVSCDAIDVYAMKPVCKHVNLFKVNSLPHMVTEVVKVTMKTCPIVCQSRHKISPKTNLTFKTCQRLVTFWHTHSKSGQTKFLHWPVGNEISYLFGAMMLWQ